MSCCIKKMPSLLPDDTCHHIVMCLKPTYSSLTGILPCIYFVRLLRPLHCLYCFVLRCIFCVSTLRATLLHQVKFLVCANLLGQYNLILILIFTQEQERERS